MRLIVLVLTLLFGALLIVSVRNETWNIRMEKERNAARDFFRGGRVSGDHRGL